MAYQRISAEHLDALCPELRALIDDAVASGNEVAETWTSLGNGVALREATPILGGVSAATRACLRYRAISDPHYWMGEIWCTRHPGWYVAVPYGSQFTPRTESSFRPGLRAWRSPSALRRWWRQLRS